MNCTYCTDMETGKVTYSARRQQPQGLAAYQAKKAAQEAASLAPYSIVKDYGNWPWHVLKDGRELGTVAWFETKKAAVAWIEEQKQKEQQQEQERPETISNEQKEEKTMKTYSEWLALGEDRWNARNELQNDVKTLKTIYRETHDDGPKKTAAAFVAAVGYNRAAAALGTLVNRHAWDGRISRRVSTWAAALPVSWDEDAAQHFGVYADDVIHLANLDWLAVHFMQLTPPDPDETPDDHSETETPAQDAEQQPETTDDHSAQEQPAEQKEEKTMKKVEFKPAAIVVNGQEYTARYEYGETPRNHYLPTIRIFTALSGNACIVELPDDDPEYMNARAVMEQADETTDDHSETETPAQDAEQQPETTDDHSAQEQPAEQEQPAAEQPDETPAAEQEQPAEQAAQDAEQPAEQEQPKKPDDHSETETPAQDAEQQPEKDPKQARGPVPEKTFVGTSIQGKGYSILFDGGANRTRVIVADETREKARPIIEKAGFYYSAALDSWNKKLTFRAYRAAQALAAELDKALAA